MVPLGVMLVAWAVARSLRVALAVMFVFTAISHFLPRTRSELVRMVPPVFPRAALLVTLTGILEAALAAGLLAPALTAIAAWTLVALLVALFPANVYAARAELTIGGRPAPPLWIRLPMQLFWIGALITVARQP